MSGEVSAAGWTVGLDETVQWIAEQRGDDLMLFVDAPLVVQNATGQRLAETHVGQRYGRHWVSANSTNLATGRLAGVHLRERLEARGWRYDDGRSGPTRAGRTMSECYPYTTIVGASELGYDDKRPAYKRARKGMPAAQAWPIRTRACDELISRIDALRASEVPIDLRSHPVTADLATTPSPATPKAYKQREDLLDAVICAWTAAFWHRYGLQRSQVLGDDPAVKFDASIATIIAPTRDMPATVTANLPNE